MRQKLFVLATIGLLCAPIAAFAQQTGSVVGRVTASDGSALPGVTVEARADVLPSPRITVTGATGDYRLPALPPGSYTLKFVLSGMQTVTREAAVPLGQELSIDIVLSVAGVTEAVTVRAEASMISRDEATIKSGVSYEQIKSLPIGQEYRDLLKLIPGVQYSQDATRGPSAGGSGQDNVYLFDGVNVTLPLFGTLSAEPATHDIAQVNVVKGGARAVDFDRSGGFTIDSVSKSGTNRYAGMFSYQFQRQTMVAALTSGSLSRYEQNRAWWDMNVGGPAIPNRLFFYASYYRPENNRSNRSNVYGDLPEYTRARNEGFGKLTYTPTNSVLVNFSYRDSHNLGKSTAFGGTQAPTTGTGDEAWWRNVTADGSWIINANSYVAFKFTDFANKTQSRPDNLANIDISTAIGTKLDVNSLDTQGLLSVPLPIAGQTAYNAFIQPLIDRYGYLSSTTGLKTGGGTVGYGATFDKDDFYRTQGQVAYNLSFGGKVRHDVHAGYQRYVDSEDLWRSSNGWGSITVPGGRTNYPAGAGGTPIYYAAQFWQQSLGTVPKIHSEYVSQSFEANDTIRLQRWTFNVGALFSNDKLYGQDLRADSAAVSGYVLSRGTKYLEYDLPFSKMIQPRVGATWAYDGKNTVFVSYARYNPSASSLPRAASWARSTNGAIYNVYFDANGTLFGVDPTLSSSGKLFVPDMTPRQTDEFLYGTARQFSDHFTARLYGRYRHSTHFWEDTNNNARRDYQPPAGIPQDLYIPNLAAMMAQIGTGGSGNSYVIAELDGAYTKYHEVSMETEYRSSKVFVRGSYTWSHYFGNFDQDNTTVTNDANIFIGSSNIADGPGRQLWNFKDGTLHGDRPHQLKLYGYYLLNWNATAGAYFIAQSGQPWETWSYEPYKNLTSSTSDTIRYAEPAGSRRTPTHWQLDLNYSQSVRLGGRYTGQIVADLFNVFNKQTGYNYQPSIHSSQYGQPRSYFDPRRFQLAFRLQF